MSILSRQFLASYLNLYVGILFASMLVVVVIEMMSYPVQDHNVACIQLERHRSRRSLMKADSLLAPTLATDVHEASFGLDSHVVELAISNSSREQPWAAAHVQRARGRGQLPAHAQRALGRSIVTRTGAR